MKVLVACEYSGIVREAFKAKGHDAWSCDLLDTEVPGQHIRGNVLEILNDGWDLMIAHPPCTYFAAPGMHYLKTRPKRKDELKKSFKFWMELWNATITKIAMENPVGWLSTNWRKPNQIIQPWYFGNNEMKTTCLWLKNLTRLNGNIEIGSNKNKYRPKPDGFRTNKDGYLRGNYFVANKNAHDKSRFWPGIAKAMAEQWG